MGYTDEMKRERLQKTWRESDALQAEFGGSFERYEAYARADERGLVGIWQPGSKVVRASRPTPGAAPSAPPPASPPAGPRAGNRATADHQDGPGNEYPGFELNEDDFKARMKVLWDEHPPIRQQWKNNFDAYLSWRLDCKHGAENLLPRY